MSRDYSLLLHLTLVSLLCTAVESAPYFVRIGNIYHGVYLNALNGQLSTVTSSPSFWLMDTDSIYTPDKTKSLCLDSNNQVKLCDSSTGTTDAEWSYDAGKMGLYTVSDSGAKWYLTLEVNGAGTAQLQGDNKARILVSPPAGDSDKPLVNKLKETVKKLQADLVSVKEKYNDLATLRDGIVRRNADLATQTKTAGEKYNSQVKNISDDLTREITIVEETASTIKAETATISETQQNLTDNTLPSIKDDISALQRKPGEFLEKLKQEDLEQLLASNIAEVNGTLEGYLSRHRLAPACVYDWLVIVTTVLYVVYFVDILGRAAGWRCCVSKRVQRFELEMEPPSNIEPEYYLQDDETTRNFEFARTRESIKGKLQLKPIVQ